jgi:hypothetical protein
VVFEVQVGGILMKVVESKHVHVTGAGYEYFDLMWGGDDKVHERVQRESEKEREERER